MFITCNCLNNKKYTLQAMLYCIMYWKTKPSLQTTTNQMHRCVLISSFSTERKLKCLYISNNWSKDIDLKILVSNFYNKKFKKNHTITLCLCPCGLPMWFSQVVITQFWNQHKTFTNAAMVDQNINKSYHSIH